MNITDYKRVKGDLKKANADVAKLRKKASKKMGKQEYTDQFRESMRVSKVFYKELKLNNRANIISIICFINPPNIFCLNNPLAIRLAG